MVTVSLGVSYTSSGSLAGWLMKLASTPPLGCFSLLSYTQTWGSARSFAAEPRAFSVVSSSKPSSLTELKDIDHKRAGRGPRNDSFAEPLRRDFQEREEGTFSLHPPAPPVSLTGLAGMAAADARPGAAIPVELRRERRMVCVEYPGVVRDVSKMLRTLGGEEGVSRVRSGESPGERRVAGLRLRGETTPGGT